MHEELQRVLTHMRPAFSRQATYNWFVIVFVGFMVCTDTLGVSSIVRALMLAPESYTCLLHFFHSTAWTVEGLMAVWWEWLVFALPCPKSSTANCTASGKTGQRG